MRKLFQNHRSLFIPFIMAGHPNQNDSINAIKALSRAGADIIELGVPFSDPVADGPINQRAAEIALAEGTTLHCVLSMIKQVRLDGIHTPIIIFSYYNPIIAMGLKKFAISAKQSGADGVLIVDLPPEEGEEIYSFLQSEGLEIILLASPTTQSKRLDLYRKLNPAFLYYISRLSVTGIQTDISPALQQEIAEIKPLINDIPIAIGFGISSTSQAKIIAQFAQGVIIGSYLVKTLSDQGVTGLEHIVNQLADIIHKPND